jgi:anti-sigma regulatory factor (Ser/Thr protein kinase)
MPPVLWVNQGEIKHQFHSTHMALGIMSENMFDAGVTTIDLPAEGFVFAYTDGLTEQENANGLAFSTDRLINIIAQKPENLLQELSQNLFRYVGVEDYTDDVSICMIKPDLVFSGLTDVLETASESSLPPQVNNHFEWSLRLSGLQLESCEIPPLCNHFLQQVGVDQQLCQKIFAVLAEMVSNALDHGVLGLSSDIKENPDGFMQYFYEREERLKSLTDKDFVTLSMQWLPGDGDGCLLVEVEDSGKGYMPKSKVDEATAKYSGRGTSLIQKLSESVEIIAPGNKIRATIK